MFELSNQTLFDWYCEILPSENKKDFLIKKIKSYDTDLTKNDLSKIGAKLSKVFLPRVAAYMKACKWRKSDFQKTHAQFLQNDFRVDLAQKRVSFGDLPSLSGVPNFDEPASSGELASLVESVNKTAPKRGRSRSLSYRESCVRVKQRRVQSICETYTEEEIQAAHNRFQRLRKKNTAEKLPKTDPAKRSIEADNFDLAAFMNGDLSKRKWSATRRYNKKKCGSYIWPSYNKIRKLKDTCYPEKEFISITSSGASVDTQALLDHTAERIVSLMNEEKIESLKGKVLTLRFKAGMDGSAGQRQYQQNSKEHVDDNESTRECEVLESDNDDEFPETSDVESDDEDQIDDRFSDDSDNEETNESENVEPDTQNILKSGEEDNLQKKNINYSSIFIVCCVPLELSSPSNTPVWINPDPSSSRYCRPLKFEFMKEDVENMTKTYRYYNYKFDHLLQNKIQIGEDFITIKYEVDFTMIDGKTCNAITGQTASSNCNICDVCPTQMNNLEKFKDVNFRKTFKSDCYKFGLSTLHCKIRFMEALLNLAYYMPFKKNRCTQQYHQLKKDRKKEIQEQLKKEIGILVDVVKQGFGTTNTGNTARRFFAQKNIKKVSEILQIEEELITRFSVILEVLSANKKVIVEPFETYCGETAKFWVDHYNWKYMTPTVHKVLIHGGAVIKELGLNIGRSCEEAQEGSNKFFKGARANKSRGISAIACNTDVILYMLVSSDPVISKLREDLSCDPEREKTKKVKKHSDTALTMLMPRNMEI